jgi:hypothetical protein
MNVTAVRAVVAIAYAAPPNTSISSSPMTTATVRSQAPPERPRRDVARTPRSLGAMDGSLRWIMAASQLGGNRSPVLIVPV